MLGHLHLPRGKRTSFSSEEEEEEGEEEEEEKVSSYELSSAVRP
jgi:hypothetical protein